MDLRRVVDVDPFGAEKWMTDGTIPVHNVHQDTTLYTQKKNTITQHNMVSISLLQSKFAANKNYYSPDFKRVKVGVMALLH